MKIFKNQRASMQVFRGLEAPWISHENSWKSMKMCENLYSGLQTQLDSVPVLGSRTCLLWVRRPIENRAKVGFGCWFVMKNTRNVLEKCKTHANPFFCGTQTKLDSVPLLGSKTCLFGESQEKTEPSPTCFRYRNQVGLGLLFVMKYIRN